jgi:predicted NUDIX family phosphoesterase
MNEQVLVFDEGRLEGLQFTGASRSIKNFDQFFFDVLPHAFFLERELAENSPEFKQLIPYTIIQYKDKILAYKRSKAGNEGRLRNKWSIGFGGHINPEDFLTGNLQAAIGMCMAREITEELEWSTPESLAAAKYKETALLYDPSNDVGKVHFGIVITIQLSDDFEYSMVSKVEDEIAEIRWVTKEEARELENLENWSKLLL